MNPNLEKFFDELACLKYKIKIEILKYGFLVITVIFLSSTSFLAPFFISTFKLLKSLPDIAILTKTTILIQLLYNLSFIIGVTLLLGSIVLAQWIYFIKEKRDSEQSIKDMADAMKNKFKSKLQGTEKLFLRIHQNLYQEIPELDKIEEKPISLHDAIQKRISGLEYVQKTFEIHIQYPLEPYTTNIIETANIVKSNKMNF
jgi:hypothetical protein